MTKSRNLADSGTAFATVSATELGFVDGVTSAIQTQLDAKTAKATLTTTGDIYYASSASTPARLGIGSSAQVLTVAGGVPSWATPAAGGGMTLINTGGTALSGATTTVSSIPATYKHLYLVVTNGRTSSGGVSISLRFNNDTGSNYGYGNFKNIANTAYLGGSQSATAIDEFFITPTGSTVTHQGQLQAWIPNYTTTGGVAFHYQSYGNNGSAATGYVGSAVYNNAAAISEINFIAQATYTFTAGTIYVYGVN